MVYFGLQTRLTGGRGEGRRRRGRKGEIKQRYGCLTLVWIFVWNYEFLKGILKFYVNVHAIVWLGACPKPRVVRISS